MADAMKKDAGPADRPARAVTMEMVGRIAGVSQVTVSRALNDPSKVSPATLARIREAIAVTGFVPNALAGALASRRSQLVSALVPSMTNIVYAAMVKAFLERLRGHGYQIMLSETGFDPAEEEAMIATHLSRRPDAIMLTGTRHSPGARKMLHAAGVPVVEVWDVTETPVDVCVGFSHAAAGRAVAEHLARAGYRRAACITAEDERALRRRDAFVATFSALTGTDVPVVQFEGTASLGRGRAGLDSLIGDHRFERGAIFCSSDLLAHGVLIEAARRGLAVPDEIGVVGFGDQEFAADTVPALTTVRVDRDALGRSAADAILGRIAGREDLASVVDIGFGIVARDSA